MNLIEFELMINCLLLIILMQLLNCNRLTWARARAQNGHDTAHESAHDTTQHENQFQVRDKEVEW